MSAVIETAQEKLEAHIRDLAKWAGYTEEGRAKYPSEYKAFFPGCYATPGATELAERWGAFWMIQAVASYQTVPRAIMADKPVPAGHEEVITSNIRTKADAYLQQWEFERSARGASLYLTPVDHDTGADKPRVLVQEFQPICLRTDLFTVGTRLRFWCDCTPEGAFIMLPIEY